MHPACPNKKQNHLQNSFLRRAQFWVRKTFSKPASLKRASLVALPAAISHKASLKPKRCASATLIQKTSKNEPKHGPKNGTAWRSHFWDRMHCLVKEQKKSTFTVPFLGPSGGTKNETAKSQNQQQRPTRATNKKWQLRLVKQQAYRVGTEEARTCEAWFQLSFRSQKSTLPQQPICTPLAPTSNKIIYKTASSDGPNSGSGKHSQNRLRSKGPP